VSERQRKRTRPARRTLCRTQHDGRHGAAERQQRLKVLGEPARVAERRDAVAGALEVVEEARVVRREQRMGQLRTPATVSQRPVPMREGPRTYLLDRQHLLGGATGVVRDLDAVCVCVCVCVCVSGGSNRHVVDRAARHIPSTSLEHTPSGRHAGALDALGAEGRLLGGDPGSDLAQAAHQLRGARGLELDQLRKLSSRRADSHTRIGGALVHRDVQLEHLGTARAWA